MMMRFLSLRAAFQVIMPILLLLGLAIIAPVEAAPMATLTTTSPGPATDPNQISAIIPLQQLQTQVAPLQLHFDQDSFELSFPLSQRLKPTKASLHIEFTNSMALIDQRSQLRIRAGDVLVAQIQLHGAQPRVSADVDLPVDILHAGYNKLVVEVAQHYAWECEDPAAPELWTEVDHAKSHIAITGSLMPLNATLADLDQLLAPGVGGVDTMTVVTADAQPGEDTLRAGAIVSQALAFHLQYRQPMLEYRQLQRRAAPAAAGAHFANLDDSTLIGHDVVLMGTRDALAGVLPDDVKAKITDGFLGLYHLDADPSRLLIVVSGTTGEQVAKAASALAVANFPFDNVPSSTVHEVSIPDSATLLPKGQVASDVTYSFADLGFGTQTARSINPIDMGLNFWVPADTYTNENANIEFDLDFAYGAGLDDRSVINIFINNTFERAVPLDQSGGAILRKYAVYVPQRSFQAGLNTVRFEIAMMEHNLGKCMNTTRHDNMVLSIFDSSTVRFPTADKVAAQPNLQVLGRTGFPFDMGPHGELLDVALTSHDANTVVAYWEMMGRLAQTTGRLFDRTTAHFDVKPSDRHLLVMGTVPTLDANLMKGSKINLVDGLAGTQFLAYRNTATQSTVPGQGGMFAGIMAQLSPPMPQAPVLPVIKASGGLGDLGAILSFESPYAAHHTVVVVAAEDSATLLLRSQSLVQSAVWNQLDGDITVWRGLTDPVLHATTQTPFIIGSRSTVSFFSFYLSEHPWFWIATVVGIFFVLAVLTMYLLRRRRRRLYPHAKELN